MNIKKAKKVLCHGLAFAMAITSVFTGNAFLGTTLQAEAAGDEKIEFYKNGFEDGDYQGIAARGAATIEISTSVHHGAGNNSLSVQNRSDTWHGVQLSLEEYLISGNTYDFTAYVKQDTGAEQTIDMGIHYKNDSGADQWPTVKSSSCVSGEWTELSGSFTVPEVANGIELFFQSGSKTADFFLDDLSISGIPKEIKMFTPDDGMYQGMVEAGVFSTGNNARIKAVLEKARAGEDVSLAYIGGSITEGGGYNPNSACYAEVSATAFAKKYGKDGGANVHFINAGMSGTSSDIGIIRYQRDVLGRLPEGSDHPDILFVEFAVNDAGCETGGGAYEGLIRQALKSGSAVVLVFSVFSVLDAEKNLVGINSVEEANYRKYGTKYDLPMVSTADAIRNVYTYDGFYRWFYNDSLHPNAKGYKLMADCILELINRIDKETAEADNITDVDSIEAVTSSSYQGIKMIDSTTTEDSAFEFDAIDAGGFSGRDENIPTFQYLYNGVKGAKWFPDNWMYDGSGTNKNPLTIEVNCKTLMILYKETSESAYGSADLYVDGVKKSTLSCYNKTGWNNGKVCIALKEENSAKHKIELKMAEGSETKKFTLYAIGYQTEDEEELLRQAVEDVKALIDAIGEVSGDEASKKKIDDARKAYKRLPEAQQALIDNYDKLTDAEAKYESFENAAQAVENVKTLIDAIGEVSYNEASKKKIDDARKAYDGLTKEQQALVDNYNKLTDAEAKYKSLASPAETTKTSITKAVVNKIEDQYYTGKAIEPSLTVTCGGSNLKLNEDYTVTGYKNNTNIGTATVTIQGKGNYTGEIAATFNITVKKNAGYTVGNYKYKITDAKTDGKGTVAVSGVVNKKGKSIKVADTVNIGGVKFLVTSIDNKAFSGCGKATSATIGKNVTKIGSKAFYNCKNLKKITIKSTKLKSVGSKAFKGINKKASIKVPKSKLKAYKKLLKRKGQSSGVKIY